MENEEVKEVEKDISPISAILDENNTDNVILYNQEGEAVEFEQIAVIPLEEKDYVILRPIVPLEGMKEDEALVMEIDTVDDEQKLVLATDDGIIDKVFEIYNKLYEETYNN